MTTSSVAPYQQVVFLDTIAGAVVSAQGLTAAGAVTGASVAATLVRKGLTLVNDTYLALPADATQVRFSSSTAALFTVPLGGPAHARTVAFTFEDI